MTKKFVPRQRKRRVLDRERATSTLPTTANNGDAIEIVPLSKTERDARKKALREELAKQHAHTKVSSAKQKRLDKYIETKLKKDENAELLRKLAGTRGDVDTDMLRSIKVMGKGRSERREVYERALREREAGINVEAAEKVLYERRRNGSKQIKEEESESSASEQEDSSVNTRAQNTEQTPKVTTGSVFGAGLKRPLEMDEDGNPVIPKRQRTKAKGLRFEFLQPPTPAILEPPTDVVPDWEGFSSEDDDSTSDQVMEDSDRESESENDDGENSSENSSQGTGDDGSSEDSQEEDNVTDDESESDEAAIKIKRKARTSAFQAWAEQQRNEAIGFTPSNNLTSMPTLPATADFKPRPKEEDPLPPELVVKLDVKRTAYAVPVQRSEEVKLSRIALPVVAKEQEIMEAVFNNDVVIISGATGSGKTTQVPQFLFENGFGDVNGPTPGMVGITQPRRVAAVSMAKRVADELGDATGRVAHQIRFDSTVGRSTAVKFMTDGVLLREMSEDFSLKKYSAIVIDEAHERTVNTDILISLMSRCVKARAELAKDKPQSYKPLKLIIMSATLRVSDFRENERLFSTPPPLVQAEGRQYEVAPHWSRRTYFDFVDEAFKKVSRGHRKLPPGGILVFLTGQNEIRLLSKKLKENFAATESSEGYKPQVRIAASEMAVESEDFEAFNGAEPASGAYLEEEEEEDANSDEEETEDPDAEFTIEGEDENSELPKVHVLPLYSQLPSKEQLRVFEPAPEGSRLIVLATNVAETSLTIPGIRYVFDSGRVKERKWDRAGVQTFETTWVSKASADQRMGRAGRTGAGHCYRLYSSAIYETFQDFAEPEIYRSPLEGVVLQLKALNITRVDNFPFPTPPERENLVKAETLLGHLGALDAQKQLTPLGRELHNYPLSPRFAQMLRLATIHKCVNLAIAVVAALDVPELLISEALLDLRTPLETEGEIRTESMNVEEEQRTARRKVYNAAQSKLSSLSPVSDAIKLLGAMVLCNMTENYEAVSDQYFVRTKALKEANQLREQLTNIVANLKPGVVGKYQPRLPLPSEKEVSILRQIIAAGFVDQVAIRADCLPSPPPMDRKPKRAIDVRYRTLIPSYSAGDVADEDGKYVFLHPSSILARTPPSKLPRYIVYHRLQRSQTNKTGQTAKARFHPLTPLSGEQLAVLARGTTLLNVGKPVDKVTVLSTAADGKERRQCSVVISLVGRAGELGWPLVRKEVVQRREPREGWVIDHYVD